MLYKHTSASPSIWFGKLSNNQKPCIYLFLLNPRGWKKKKKSLDSPRFFTFSSPSFTIINSIEIDEWIHRRDGYLLSIISSEPGKIFARRWKRIGGDGDVRGVDMEWMVVHFCAARENQIKEERKSREKIVLGNSRHIVLSICCIFYERRRVYWME